MEDWDESGDELDLLSESSQSLEVPKKPKSKRRKDHLLPSSSQLTQPPQSSQSYSSFANDSPDPLSIGTKVPKDFIHADSLGDIEAANASPSKSMKMGASGKMENLKLGDGEEDEGVEEKLTKLRTPRKPLASPNKRKAEDKDGEDTSVTPKKARITVPLPSRRRDVSIDPNSSPLTPLASSPIPNQDELHHMEMDGLDHELGGFLRGEIGDDAGLARRSRSLRKAARKATIKQRELVEEESETETVVEADEPASPGKRGRKRKLDQEEEQELPTGAEYAFAAVRKRAGRKRPSAQTEGSEEEKEAVVMKKAPAPGKNRLQKRKSLGAKEVLAVRQDPAKKSTLKPAKAPRGKKGGPYASTGIEPLLEDPRTELKSLTVPSQVAVEKTHSRLSLLESDDESLPDVADIFSRPATQSAPSVTTNRTFLQWRRRSDSMGGRGVRGGKHMLKAPQKLMKGDRRGSVYHLKGGS
ncbi:hypothetical protein BT69DRAFT_1333587 [Atractiella rhizophila]|nr:hypothetical protein BT69DRAFT_1333587 [Atractiella rhizophila]